MSDLARIQAGMKAAIVAGGEPDAAVLEAVVAGKLTSAQRMRVHQNNYRQTLTSALLAIFPVAQVFVGEAFMKGVASKFTATEPPGVPMLSAYGATFADFLDAFPPVAQVPYLPDIIRLEWAVHELQVSHEQAVDDGSLRLSPNARVIDSRYPVLSLWMAGTGQIPPEAVNMKAGGQCAAAVLTGGEVRIMALDGAEKAQLAALEVGEAAITADIARMLDMGVLAGKA